MRFVGGTCIGNVVRFDFFWVCNVKQNKKCCQQPYEDPEAEAAFRRHHLSGVNEWPDSKALGQPPVVTLWQAGGVAHGALNYVGVTMALHMWGSPGVGVHVHGAVV